MTKPVNFECCLKEACKYGDLVAQFDRLTSRHVTRVLHDTRTPIERMVDEATGFQKVLDKEAQQDMRAFIAFVFEYIWLPYLANVLKEANTKC